MSEPSKSRKQNPYSWTTEKPTHVVPRAELLKKAIEKLDEGEGAFVLLGTRGMGKSVFLTHLQEEIVKVPEFETIRFDSPPFSKSNVLTAGNILRQLVNELIVSASKRSKGGSNNSFVQQMQDLQEREKLVELFEVYLNEVSGEVERVVLMYDELDAYAELHRADAGHDYFGALEAARKKLGRHLFVIAAGGGGMLALKTILGSSLFSRDTRKVLEPFGRDELEKLAEPFALVRGQPLADDIIDALLLLSGGNLALATYGLQRLWREQVHTQQHVAATFATFLHDNSDFVSSIRGAIFGFHKSEVPYHVWRSLKTKGGKLPKRELNALRYALKVESEVENMDILDMLRAAGLIRMKDAHRNADPVVAELIPSIVSFDDSEEARSSVTSLREQLRFDLMDAITLIHQWAQSFYRQGNKKQNEEKQLVPEANFAMVLAVYLTAKGWNVHLESMSGAGFADIKAEHPRFSNEDAIIEVKIWKRKVETIHNQITSYFAHGVRALATLVIGETQEPTWKDDYETTCLKGKVDGDATWKPLDRPWEGYFEAQWESRVVEHFLLRLPKRS